MSAYYECDYCHRRQDAEQPGVYAVEPTGWFSTLVPREKRFVRGAPHACSESCVDHLRKQFPALTFVQVEHKATAPRVGKEKCKWCARMGRTCPAHKPKGAT